MWHKYMAEVHNSWWFTKYFYNFNCVITYNMKGGYLYQRYYIIMHDWNTYFEPGYVFHTYNSSHCTVQRPREQWPTLTAPHPFYTQWNTTKWLVSWLAYFMIIWCILCKSPTPLIWVLSTHPSYLNWKSDNCSISVSIFNIERKFCRRLN